MLEKNNSALACCWRRQRSAYVSEHERPIILGGSPGSGTTLVRVILNLHPNIVCGPESRLLIGCFLPAKLSKRFAVPIAGVWKMYEDADDHAQFTERFLGQYAARHGKKRWGERTPENVYHVNYIFRHFPNAKFIHVIRDGRDVVHSLRSNPRYAKEESEPAPVAEPLSLAACINSWLRGTTAGLKWRNQPRCTELRFEDLVAEPEPTLRKLCEFIEEPWSPAMLAYHLSHSAESGGAPAGSSPNPILNGWRTGLSPDELATFYRRAGARLQELGYRVDSADPKLRP